MKLGFFGGSFNPPTIAHYNLVKQALVEYDFDMVYFVPMNDYYKKAGLIDMKHRIAMLEVLCKNDCQIMVSEIEKEMNYQSTAIDAFKLIVEKYPNDEIVFLMGEDNFLKMNTWKDYDELKKYNYVVFQRNEKCMLNISQENVSYMKNNENLEISSTIIRNRLQKNVNIDDLVTVEVKKYILDNGLYLKN